MNKNIENFVGEKYEETKNLRLDKIKKLIEKDISYELEQGNLPKGEYQVEYSYPHLPGVIDVYAIIDLNKHLSPEETAKYQEDIEKVINRYNKITGCVMQNPWNNHFFSFANVLTTKEIELASKNASIID